MSQCVIVYAFCAVRNLIVKIIMWFTFKDSSDIEFLFFYSSHFLGANLRNVYL